MFFLTSNRFKKEKRKKLKIDNLNKMKKTHLPLNQVPTKKFVLDGIFKKLNVDVSFAEN